MAKSLTTPEERVAMFQQLFSDTIPHNKALGIKVLAVARGLASMQIEWRKEFVGNPETGVVAGGPLTAMLDSCCGMAVATMLKDPKPFATLDLRIDYAKPGDARQAGDRRGRVLSHHALGRLHPRLRSPGRSQGSRRRGGGHLHARHQGQGDARPGDRQGAVQVSAAAA